jgi:2-keto-4-pentenoate hydratase/2-oxohepta-3-ene-1,7-dioic acid hydratase in catechol pathway
MRLVSYRRDEADRGSWRAGIVSGEHVVDCAALGEAMGVPRSPQLASVKEVLARGPEVCAELERAAAGAEERLSRSELRIGPPVPDPSKIVCVGLNYREHAGEVAMEVPAAPILFAKFPNALVGDGDPIVVPPLTTRVDYEGELAVVIARRCRWVPASEALDVVGGYMPFNDVSARDLQMQVSQWTAGKAIDTFAPCGPELVLAGEVDDVQALQLTTRLNGETVQNATTDQMLFPVATLVAYVSSLMTLEPGDLIATGTPSGVGFTREPPIFLADGDVVEVEIGGIATLRNPVVAAAAAQSITRPPLTSSVTPVK